MTRSLFLFLLVLLVAGPVVGQAQQKVRNPFVDPFANPVDDPELPRVLIVGDSISIGYTPLVRKLLDGKANVHRVTTNCRWSAYGDEHIAKWLGDSQWDVIHFNFGLWDWYGWSQETKSTPESFAANLESIVKQLKKTEATLIFANTTPPCIGPERKAKIVISEARAKEFATAAAAVMAKHQIEINDLYGLIGEQRAKYQRAENDVHYNAEGGELLAKQVAKVIEKAVLEPLPNSENR